MKRYRPRKRVRTHLEPHARSKPEPMEILARMAGRTAFRDPKAVTGIPVTAQDVAHAIAAARDPYGDPTDRLGASMAMAIACQRRSEWSAVESMGRPRLLDVISNQRHYPHVCDAPYTFRARIALFDAFGDLIAPQHRRNIGEAAKDSRMPKNMYLYLLDSALAMLEAAANTAAADAVRYLFALAAAEHPLVGQVRVVSFSDGGGIHVWTEGETVDDVLDSPHELCAIDIDQLINDALRRPRAPGLLQLTGLPA